MKRSIFHPDRLSKSLAVYYADPANQPSPEKGFVTPKMAELYKKKGFFQSAKLKADNLISESRFYKSVTVGIPFTGMLGFLTMVPPTAVGIAPGFAIIMGLLVTTLGSGVYTLMATNEDDKLEYFLNTLPESAIDNAYYQWIFDRYGMELDDEQKLHLKEFNAFNYEDKCYFANSKTVDGQQQVFLAEADSTQRTKLNRLIRNYNAENKPVAVIEPKEPPLVLPLAQKQRSLNELEYIEA